MTRPSDTIKAARSYIVHEDAATGVFIKSSHWVPGYTPAHKETPDEAIQFAINDAEEKVMAAQAHLIELLDFKASFEAGVEVIK